MLFLFYPSSIAFFVLFVVLTILVEVEWYGWAVLEVILFGIAAACCVKFGWFALTLPHVSITDVLLYSAVYVGAGIVWSFAKWATYLFKYRGQLRAAVADFKSRNKLPANAPLGDDDATKLTETLSYDLRHRPTAAQNKARIVAWMSFWPCSLIGFVLNDPVKRLFNFVFNALKNSYQQVANAIVSDKEYR